LPITTLKDLDRSLLDSSPLEGTELREAMLLIKRIVRSSTLETPVKRYIERSGAAFERTFSEVALLRKELTQAKELLRVRKKRKRGKRAAVKESPSLIRRKSSNSSKKQKRRYRKGSRKRDERQGL
jgi:hypothetical protein